MPSKHLIFFTTLAILTSTAFCQSSTVTPNPDTATKEVTEGDIVFTKVEKEAYYPGGLGKWQEYLVNHLKANVAVKAGMPPGIYSVKVDFMVDKTGSVTNVHAVDAARGCIECTLEAVRVIKKSPAGMLLSKAEER